MREYVIELFRKYKVCLFFVVGKDGKLVGIVSIKCVFFYFDED